MSIDYVIQRLTYEILNISLEEIADSMGLTLQMIQNISEKQKWQQWFPDDDCSIFSLDNDTTLNEDEELLEGEDIFSVRADQFLDKNRKRLQVFNMAKELAMAEQYANLEVSLIEKAREAISLLNAEDIKELKDLSGIFKDLAKQLQQMGSSITMGQDEATGLPTVIIKDLSGT